MEGLKRMFESTVDDAPPGERVGWYGASELAVYELDA